MSNIKSAGNIDSQDSSQEAGNFEFKDLLFRQGIDPKGVLVLRHSPKEPGLRRVIRWLASERPETFNAYQQAQPPRVESAMLRSTHVASFIGDRPGRAMFVGLYSRGSYRSLTRAEFWQMPVYQELQELGMNAFENGRDSTLFFDLSLLNFYRHWFGRLVVEWPGLERSWFRWADKNSFSVKFIAEDSMLDAEMPPWQDMILSKAELQSLPSNWRRALQQLRGIYFIFDCSDGKGYVGSAYGEDNILGRWLAYAANGHGGNVELKGRQPGNFSFSILERVSPDMEQSEVVRLEGTWKARLHTRDFGLNRN